MTWCFIVWIIIICVCFLEDWLQTLLLALPFTHHLHAEQLDAGLHIWQINSNLMFFASILIQPKIKMNNSSNKRCHLFCQIFRLFRVHFYGECCRHYAQCTRALLNETQIYIMSSKQLKQLTVFECLAKLIQNAHETTKDKQ